MIELPNPNLNETIVEYIQRLLKDKIIMTSQVPLAVLKYNK